MRIALWTLLLTTAVLADASQARSLLDKGKLDQAIKAAEKAVKKNAKDIESWLVLADAWIANGDPHEAWTQIETAMESNEGSAALNVKLGDAFLAVAQKLTAERGDGTAIRSHFMDADRSYSEALKIDDKSAAAYFGRAQANFNLSGDKAEYGVKAREYVAKALMIDGKMGKAHAFQAYMFYTDANQNRRARKEKLAVEKYRTAINKYQTALKLDPSRVIDFIRLGRCFTAIGQNDQAKETYFKALVEHPDSVLPITSGLKYTFGNKYSAGVDTMKTATERAPKSMEAWFYYGFTLYANNRFAEAAKAFQKSADNAAKNPQALARNHYYVGLSHHKDGKAKQAISAYRKSLEIAPDYAEPLAAWVTLSGNPRDIDAIEKLYDELRKLAPNAGWIRNNYGLMLRNWAEPRGATQKSPPPDAARRIKKSAMVYEEAAKLMPSDPQVQSDTGLLFEFYPVNFDAEKAKGYFTRSLELSGYCYRDAFDGLTRLCRRTGDWETLADYADGVVGALESGKNPIAPVGASAPAERPNARAGMLARARAALKEAKAKSKG